MPLEDYDELYDLLNDFADLVKSPDHSEDRSSLKEENEKLLHRNIELERQLQDSQEIGLNILDEYHEAQREIERLRGDLALAKGSPSYGYLCSIEGIKLFVIAENISDCMDKLELMAEGNNYQLEIHKSIEVKI